MNKTPTPTGQPPAVVLWNPKYAHNVGAALRSCACYDVKQLWWTGDRVTLDTVKGERLPREERMKGYRHVEMVRDDRAFDRFPPGCTPVAVEVRENAENLFTFEHPANPVYVFGPEDGSLNRVALSHCHRFVYIPSRHCLNLSVAVATVLYDWRLKRVRDGIDAALPLGETLHEERGFADGADVFEGISADGLGVGAAARRRTFR